MLNSYPSHWSEFAWKLLKPTSLLRSIVTMVKIASTGFQKAININNFKTPVAYGASYKSIQIKLSDIKSAKLIAGFNSDKIDRSVFKYFITGIRQQGICVFCSSPDNRLALLHADFEEIDNIYFFKEYPTKFGVINAINGDHCTFCVVIGSDKRIDGQSLLNKFKGSNSDLINNSLEKTLSSKATSNGFSIHTLLNACGVIAVRSISVLKKVWKEGNSYFGLTVNNELIQDRNITNVSHTSDILNPGDSLTDRSSDGVVVLYNGSYKYLKRPDSDLVNLSAYPLLGNYYAELQGLNEIPWYSFIHILQSNKSYNYITSFGTDKVNTQKVLDSNILLPSDSLLYSSINIKIPKGTIKLNNIDTYDSVYIFYSDYTDVKPEVYVNITSRSLLLKQAEKYGVLRITNCQKSPTGLIAITPNGECFGRELRCGNYLYGIALVKSGKTFRDDAIFKYLVLKPVLAKAGANFVIHIDN